MPSETENLTQASKESSLIFRPSSFFEPLDVEKLFPERKPLEVELGSGDGSFLAQYAARHPEWNFIGVERLLGRLRKLDRKGLRAQLKNLKLLRVEASYFMAYLLPPVSVQAVHVYFPDPWPKRKHRKNRLINAAFTESARRVLVPGGTVYLRTDDSDYFQQMLEVFAENKQFHPVDTPAELAAIVTDFEKDFHARGISTNHAAYQVDSV